MCDEYACLPADFASPTPLPLAQICKQSIKCRISVVANEGTVVPPFKSTRVSLSSSKSGLLHRCGGCRCPVGSVCSVEINGISAVNGVNGVNRVTDSGAYWPNDGGLTQRAPSKFARCQVHTSADVLAKFIKCSLLEPSSIVPKVPVLVLTESSGEFVRSLTPNLVGNKCPIDVIPSIEVDGVG